MVEKSNLKIMSINSIYEFLNSLSGKDRGFLLPGE